MAVFWKSLPWGPNPQTLTQGVPTELAEPGHITVKLGLTTPPRPQSSQLLFNISFASKTTEEDCEASEKEGKTNRKKVTTDDKKDENLKKRFPDKLLRT